MIYHLMPEECDNHSKVVCFKMWLHLGPNYTPISGIVVANKVALPLSTKLNWGRIPNSRNRWHAPQIWQRINQNANVAGDSVSEYTCRDIGILQGMPQTKEKFIIDNKLTEINYGAPWKCSWHNCGAHLLRRNRIMPFQLNNTRTRLHTCSQTRRHEDDTIIY